MVAAVVLAVLFLASPVVGYWVVASSLSTAGKLRIAVVGMAVLIVAPLVVLFLSST